MRLPSWPADAWRFLHAYYVAHALLFASYSPLKALLADAAAVEGPHAKLGSYEQQVVYLLPLVILHKARCTPGGRARERAHACRTPFVRAPAGRGLL